MKPKKYVAFEKIYEPVVRPDGSILFETYGEDLQRVMQTDHDRIWTLVDCDGDLFITAGYHLVNRMNYIITNHAWRDSRLCYSY